MWLIGRETQLVFQAGSTLATGRPPFPYEQVDVPRPDGIQGSCLGDAWGRLRCRTVWVLYLHGNASSVASQVNIAHYRAAAQRRPERHGAGVSRVRRHGRLAHRERASGRCRAPPTTTCATPGGCRHERSSSTAGRSAPRSRWTWLRECRRPRSSSKGHQASLVDLTGRRYPFFPLRLFMRSPFDSIRKIGPIPAPILFLHSVDDEIIPIRGAPARPGGARRHGVRRAAWRPHGRHRSIGHAARAGDSDLPRDLRSGSRRAGGA